MTTVRVIAERFFLERLAGSGGMGSVFRARDTVTGEPVAVKLMRVHEQEARGRFLREARVLCELNHPGIVSYVAHGAMPTGELFLVMEWLEGEDLAHRLDRGPLSLADSLALVERMAHALTIVHERGVVHRDINPSNVFLVGGDVNGVKLIDFGVARDDSTPVTTRSGAIVGTIAYMSPEQARGDAGLDARADVFCLGLVLHECLTGRRPFVADSIMGTLAKILFEEAPPLRDLLPDAPPALEALLARMLAKERRLRPAGAAAVTAAIAELRAGNAAAAPSERPPVAALTGREQRLLSVVSARHQLPRLRPLAVDETAPVALPEAEPGARPADLVRLVDGYGARLEPLANGTCVAIFEGAGVATDQAARAARCALAMRALLPGVAMALTTGRAFLGRRWPIGEVIDRAAQLLADPGPSASGAVRLDHVTAALLDQRFDVRMDANAIQLHGERHGEHVGRTLMGRPTPCVGRERELGTLIATLAECTSEPVARALLVTGPAGSGKSRLRQELLRTVVPDVVVLAGRGDVVGEGAPFGLVAQVVRGAAGILEGEPRPARQAKLRARVARCVAAADVDRVTTFLAEVAGAPFPNDQSAALAAARRDATLMGDQIRRAWDDWLSAETAAATVLIVLENLQWGDLPSVRLVESALRNLADRPLFVLALGRPEARERFPRLWADTGMQVLNLGPLSRKASEKLVRFVLGDDLDAELGRRLVDRAGGNPLFLEELLRGAAEGRDTNPETVVAMVAARLGALEPEARRVLRGASVFGTVFWDGGVQALLGETLPPDEVFACLQRLGERELIQPRPSATFPGLREYAFVHDLVREAAYAMLTDGDRTLGHRLAGRFLETVGEIDALVLAEHFERGAEPGRAAVWYQRAAAQALEGNDFQAAIARAERGLSSGAAEALAGSLRVAQAEALRWQGGFVDAERAARAAMDDLPHGSALWCAAVAELARASKAQNKGAELALLAERLLAAGGGTPDLSVAALIVAGTVLQMGRYDLARRLAAGVAEGESAGDPHVAAWLHAVRGFDAKSQGDPAAYLAEMQDAADAFRRLGDLRRASLYGETNVGYAYLELGAYGRAEPVLRAAMTSARQLGLSNIAAVAAQNLGVALAHRGALAEAVACEEEAVAAFGQQGDRRLQSLACCYLSQIVAASDPARARREAAAAVELAGDVLPCRAFALAQLGRVLLTAGDVVGAVGAAEEGMGILGRLGALEEGESLLRLVHVEALLAAGRADEAAAALDVARARVEERAGRITVPELRAGFLADVPEHARTIALHLPA